MGPVTGAKEPAEANYAAAALDYAYARQSLAATTAKELVRRGTGNALQTLAEAVNGDLHATGACERGAEQGRQVSQFDVIQCRPLMPLPGRIAGGTTTWPSPGGISSCCWALPAAEIAVASAIQCTATGDQRIGALDLLGATP